MFEILNKSQVHSSRKLTAMLRVQRSKASTRVMLGQGSAWRFAAAMHAHHHDSWVNRAGRERESCLQASDEREAPLACRVDEIWTPVAALALAPVEIQSPNL
jgi:hypothetical protein